MTGSPIGSSVSFDGAVAVVHSRRLVAETLCIALRGIGIDARLGSSEPTPFALVDTSEPATIERMTQESTAVLAFGSADPVTVARALRSGAAWHVGDETSFVEIAEHLCSLAMGDPATDAAMRRVEASPQVALLDRLTRREQEVLRGLVSGRRAADIAEGDFVSVTTVRNQIQAILTKLGAHSQLEAVSIAVRAGWTPLAA